MDVSTIIICIVLVILALTSPLFNALHRGRALRKNPDSANYTCPTFSIIISVHDNAAELERNLPSILSQDYPEGYEVIVVDESSTDETEEVLKRFKKTFPCLYSTFIPESSHYLSRRKLALTIGIKAAKNEWLILTDADCKPKSVLWLQTMARYCNDSNDMVLGYSNYVQSAKSFYRFEQLLISCYAMRTAKKGIAFCYNGNNLAIRKSVFMKHNGFLKNLRYLRGEYDFIVNEYAQNKRTAVTIEPNAHIIQEEPSCKRWANEHVFYMETWRHLHRKLNNSILFVFDNAVLHINYLAQLAAIVYSAITTNWMILSSALVSLLVTIAIRIVIANKILKMFEELIPLWRIPFMEIRVIWQYTAFMIRHAFSDKNDFIRK